MRPLENVSDSVVQIHKKLTGLPFAVHIKLKPFGAAEVEALVKSTTKAQSVESVIIDDLLAQTEGSEYDA
jgi:hypothetical protein